MARARPAAGFEGARRNPAPILIGLAIGTLCTLVAGVYFWFYAPLLPFVVGGIMTVFRRTQAFGLGVLAAACGSVAFLVTLLVLFTAL